MQTIKVDGEIVGSISKFEIGNEAEITYWIDRKFWGNGIATTALKHLLKIEKTRQFMDGLLLIMLVHKKF